MKFFFMLVILVSCAQSPDIKKERSTASESYQAEEPKEKMLLNRRNY